jgi:hypothetical protein
MRVGKTGMYEPLWLFEKAVREHERFITIEAMLRLSEKSCEKPLECFVLEVFERDKHIVEDKKGRWVKINGQHKFSFKKAKQRLRQYIINRLFEKEELLYFIDRHADRQPEFYIRAGVKKCR